MPCSARKARILLREGKAKVVSRVPFVIKLLVPTGETKQEIAGGMDTGSKKIGCAVISNGEVIYQSEIQVRQDVSKKMKQRLMYRRTRRSRLRYRPVRWMNRSSMRRTDRLASSLQSKVDSHLREKRFVESILPISRWKVETASFDIHKITNPEVEGKGYQEGNQKDYYNVKAYVLHRDGYKCQHCRGKSKDKKLHAHHVIWKSNGGTDEPGNLLTMCETCHDDLHKGLLKLSGKRSKTKHATEIGIVKSQLKKLWNFEECFGYETKWKREQFLELPKTHCNDAIAICCEEGEVVGLSNVAYFKRHVSAGDYQQTKGKRSEINIPTGKLFGLRKFDLVETAKGTGFVKGKRSTGFFTIADVDWNMISPSVNVKRNCKRLSARTTTLTRRRNVHSSHG
jgi:5-methylcytosine-specific restriction endonuclease McrA